MKTKYKELFRCNIAGVQYGDYQLCLGLKAGLKLDLFWERNNPLDSRAIRVEYNGVKLGYIPRDHNRSSNLDIQSLLHQYRELGTKVYTTLTAVNKNNPSWSMFTLKCEIRENASPVIRGEF